jgi:hypothetical protein
MRRRVSSRRWLNRSLTEVRARGAILAPLATGVGDPRGPGGLKERGCRIGKDLRRQYRMVLPAAAPLARLQLWPLRR